jgi:hypothetical protein
MSYIYTYEGYRIPFENGLSIDPRLISITDIAHALSNICRYTGHTSKFYSVAEHSIHVSRLVPAKDAFWGLIHDAAEAYVGDLNRPLKFHLPNYKRWEATVMSAVIKKFSLHPVIPNSVRLADDQMLVNEMRDLMGGTKPDPMWMPTKTAYVDLHDPMSPEHAKLVFLNEYDYLLGGANG